MSLTELKISQGGKKYVRYFSEDDILTLLIAIEFLNKLFITISGSRWIFLCKFWDGLLQPFYPWCSRAATYILHTNCSMRSEWKFKCALPKIFTNISPFGWNEQTAGILILKWRRFAKIHNLGWRRCAMITKSILLNPLSLQPVSVNLWNFKLYLNDIIYSFKYQRSTISG